MERAGTHSIVASRTAVVSVAAMLTPKIRRRCKIYRLGRLVAHDRLAWGERGAQRM